MWGGILFWFAFLWWFTMLMIFSCAYWPCLLHVFFEESSIYIFCPFFSWVVWIFLLLHCLSSLYVLGIKPLSVTQSLYFCFIWGLSPTYRFYSSSKLFNIWLQFPHLKMETVIVPASSGCDTFDNYSDGEVNRACELQEKEHCSLPKELRRASKKIWHMTRALKDEKELEAAISLLFPPVDLF